MDSVVARWLPPARITHLCPQRRCLVKHLRCRQARACQPRRRSARHADGCRRADRRTRCRAPCPGIRSQNDTHVPAVHDRARCRSNHCARRLGRYRRRGPLRPLPGRRRLLRPHAMIGQVADHPIPARDRASRPWRDATPRAKWTASVASPNGATAPCARCSMRPPGHCRCPRSAVADHARTCRQPILHCPEISWMPWRRRLFGVIGLGTGVGGRRLQWARHDRRTVSRMLPRWLPLRSRIA